LALASGHSAVQGGQKGYFPPYLKITTFKCRIYILWIFALECTALSFKSVMRHCIMFWLLKLRLQYQTLIRLRLRVGYQTINKQKFDVFLLILQKLTGKFKTVPYCVIFYIDFFYLLGVREKTEQKSAAHAHQHFYISSMNFLYLYIVQALARRIEII
jgi:hypothetical protein